MILSVASIAGLAEGRARRLARVVVTTALLALVTRRRRTVPAWPVVVPLPGAGCASYVTSVASITPVASRRVARHGVDVIVGLRHGSQLVHS